MTLVGSLLPHSLFNDTLNASASPVSCGNVTKIVPNFEVSFLWLLSESVTHQPISSPHQILEIYGVFVQFLRKLSYSTTITTLRGPATQELEKQPA